MNRIGKMLGAVVAVLAVAVVGFGEDSVEDKKLLHEWRQVLAKTKKGDVEEAARGMAEHFRGRGAEVLPWIREGMLLEDADVLSALVDVVELAFPGGAEEIAPYLTVTDRRVRENAVWALATLGEPASPAIGLLTESLEDEPGIRLAAATAFARIGKATPEALESLRSGVHSNDEALANAMIRGLAGVGDATSLEPLLRSAETRRRVVKALWSSGPEAHRALRPLADSKSWLVRAAVARLLGRDRADRELAYPLAVRLAADETATVRRPAFEAMWIGGPATPEALAAVRAEMTTPDFWCGWAALDALRAMEGSDEQRSDLLAEVLTEDETRTRGSIVRALAVMPSITDAAYDALGREVEHPHMDVAAYAAVARVRRGDRDDRVVKPIVTYLTEGYSGVALWESALLRDRVIVTRRPRAERNLEPGSTFRPVRPPRERLKQPGILAALHALGEPARVALIARLNDVSSPGRDHALWALHKAFQDSAPDFGALLEDKNGNVRFAAGLALAESGKHLDRATETLARYAMVELDGETWEDKTWAKREVATRSATALANLGGPSLPAMERQLDRIETSTAAVYPFVEALRAIEERHPDVAAEARALRELFEEIDDAGQFED